MSLNQIVAEEIYSTLQDKGVELGNASIPLIREILDLFYKSEEWERIALTGNVDKAVKLLWDKEYDNPKRNIVEIHKKVLHFMDQHGVIPEEK